MRFSAFTLIELLVVVTIIVVLLALLVPALDKAIEAAERAQCATQLHVWGSAITQYSFEHRRTLMASVQFGGATNSGHLYPNLVWARSARQPADDSDPQTKDRQWCAERMMPYIGGVDATDKLGWTQPWYCPSNAASNKDAQNVATAELSDWFVSDYAYFARAELWGQAHASRPQDLSGRALSSGKLLMADALYDFRNAGTWWFNHGKTSHSTHAAAYGEPVQNRPEISGTNQLFGDGSVSWKDLTRFKMKELTNPSGNGAWVSSLPGRLTHQANNHY